MAYETGTADDHIDYWDKLVSFLTTNADLVAAGEEWQQVWPVSGGDQTTGLVMRGPGLANQNQIYVGMRMYQDAQNEAWWIDFWGMTGALADADTVTNHVNVGHSVRVLLDANPMTYWFVANGRRFAMVHKISTIFEAAYCGFFLPYATPISYGYPLFIGGSAGPGFQTHNPYNWRGLENGHRHFMSPWYNGASFQFSQPSATLIDPSGQWLEVGNLNNWGHVNIGPEVAGNGVGDTGINRVGMNNVRTHMGSCYGGQYPLLPATFIQNNPRGQTLGILQGCYWCQGSDNASENIITVGGVDHLVVQDVFRTGLGDYWALALE